MGGFHRGTRGPGERSSGRAGGQSAQPSSAGHQDRRSAARPALDAADHLHRHLHPGLRGDVLFHLEAPQVAGCQGGHLPRIGRGRGGLDRGAVPDRHRHGAAGHQGGGGAEGHHQRRSHHQGHGLPVEVGLRLHQRRGRGHRLFVHTGFVAARAVGRRHAPGRRLPAARRQPAGGAGRQEDPHHHHGQRRDPRLDGAGLRRQAGRDSGLRARHLVPRRADRRFLRPVRRTVRQGTRLHAHPREGAAAE